MTGQLLVISSHSEDKVMAVASILVPFLFTSCVSARSQPWLKLRKQLKCQIVCPTKLLKESAFGLGSSVEILQQQPSAKCKLHLAEMCTLTEQFIAGTRSSREAE